MNKSDLEKYFGDTGYKPEGITSGQALLELQNIEFIKYTNDAMEECYRNIVTNLHRSDPTYLTQEEIDKLCEEITNALHNNSEFKKMIEESGLDQSSTTGCWHEWKSYQGFTDNYDYCDKCGVKR